MTLVIYLYSYYYIISSKLEKGLTKHLSIKLKTTCPTYGIGGGVYKKSVVAVSTRDVNVSVPASDFIYYL